MSSQQLWALRSQASICFLALLAALVAAGNPYPPPIDISMMMDPLQSHIQEAIFTMQSTQSGPFMAPPETNRAVRAYTEDVCTDALSCWLDQITFAIPDFSFTVNGIDCTISNLVCAGIDLASIDSAYIQPQALQFGFDGLGTACDGDWSFYQQAWPHLSNAGSLTMLMSDTSLDSSVFLGKEAGFPTFMNLTQCVLSDIKFTFDFHDGGVVGWILELMSGAIEKIMENAMKKIVCQGLEVLINVNGTYFLQHTLDPALEEIVASGPSPIEPLEGMISWSDDTKIDTAAMILDTLLNPAYDNHWNDGINTIMSGLTADGVLVIDVNVTHTIPVVDPVSGPLANITIFVHSMTLSGLTSFNEFVLIRASEQSPESLETIIALDKFGVYLDMSVNVDLAQMAITGTNLEEKFGIELETEAIRLATNMVLGIPEHYYSNLFVDQLQDPACVMGGIEVFNFSSLSLNLTLDTLRVDKLTVEEGSLEEDIDDLINNVLLLITEDFKWLITNVVNGAMQGPVREGLNSGIRDMLDQATADGCAPHVHQNETYWVSWNESQVITTFNKLVNDLIGPQGVNALVDALLPNGTLHIHLPMSAKKITSVDLIISGLDSFYDLAVWSPAANKQYELDTNLGIGYCGDDWCHPLEMAIYIVTDIDTIKIALNLENLHIFVDWLAGHDMAKLANLQVAQLTASGCIGSTFDQIALRKFDALSTSAFIQINDKHIDITDPDHSLQSFLKRIHFNESLNEDLENRLVQACDTCNGVVPPDEHDSDDDSGWVIPLSIVLAGSISSLIIFVYMYYRCWRNQKKRQEAEASGHVYPHWYELWDFRHTLVCNESIPLWLRVSVPVVLVGTIVMFITSNIDVGASVQMTLKLNDKKITPDPLFEFGLANSVEDMWDANVYALSILIAVFSGGWPYVKLAFMLVAWCTPALVLPAKKREQLLCYLDALSKWSLVDSYVLVLMMVAFRFHIALTKGDNKAVIDIVVIPMWGFYGFLLATMISLGMSHIILAVHRYTEDKRVVPEHGPMRALADHAYSLYDGTQVRASTAGKIFVALIIVFSTVMVCVGSWINSFSFEFQGLTGWMLGDDAKQGYSVVSVGETLPSASGSPNDFGVRWIQSTYFAFGVAIPLALTLALFTLWVKPLTLSAQRQLFVLSEVLNAWSGLEVMVVSVVAALLQISQFAKFIIGDSCDEIDEFLKKYMDDQLDGNDTCFDVVATLDEGCWALFLSAALFIFVMWPIMRMAHRALEERMDEECPVTDLNVPLVDTAADKLNMEEKKDEKMHVAFHIFKFLERCKLVEMESPDRKGSVNFS